MRAHALVLHIGFQMFTVIRLVLCLLAVIRNMNYISVVKLLLVYIVILLVLITVIILLSAIFTVI